jgi:hypothetical protein
MQVEITYTEIQYFVVSRKVEMTKKNMLNILKLTNTTVTSSMR